MLLYYLLLALASWAVGFVLARRAGHEVGVAALIGFGLIVPLVNMVVLIWFLVAEWPVQRQLRVMRRRHVPAAEHEDWEVAELFSEAARLEDAGDWSGAQRMYERAVEVYAGTRHEQYARACVRAVAKKAARARR